MLWCSERSFKSEIDTIKAENVFFFLVLKLRFSEIKQCKERDFEVHEEQYLLPLPKGTALLALVFLWFLQHCCCQLQQKECLPTKWQRQLTLTSEWRPPTNQFVWLFPESHCLGSYAVLSHNELKNKPWYLIQKAQHSFQNYRISTQIRARHCSFKLLWLSNFCARRQPQTTCITLTRILAQILPHIASTAIPLMNG